MTDLLQLYIQATKFMSCQNSTQKIKSVDILQGGLGILKTAW